MPFILALVFVCALVFANPSKAETIPPSSSTHDWVAAYVELLNTPAFNTLTVQLTVPLKASSYEPLLYAQDQGLGSCLLTIRTNEHPLIAELESLVPADLVPLWRKTTLVHELAHCWRWTQHPNALPEGPSDEVFADIAALSWVAQTHPAQFPAIHRAYQNLRTKWAHPDHPDTAVIQPAAFFHTTMHPFAYALTWLQR